MLTSETVNQNGGNISVTSTIQNINITDSATSVNASQLGGSFKY